jgi:hypothetical protein
VAQRSEARGAVAFAFIVPALASGAVASALAAGVSWLVDTLTGASLGGAAPWVILGAGALVAILVFVAERIALAREAHRLRMRGTGEPWAYRPRR